MKLYKNRMLRLGNDMDSIESEKDAAKRLGLYNFLIIDKGCDEFVSQAIKRFRG